MKAIVYTPESNIDGEIDKLAAILDAGADFLYIRKPELDDFSLVDYMESIPEKYWGRCVSTSLIITKEFNLGGYHFTREIIRNNASYNVKVQGWLRDHGKLSSVSAHSLDEIKAFSGGFDHVLVAPVFESISKQDHRYPWNFPELKNTLAGLHSVHPSGMNEMSRTRFFAVGGVDITKIPEIQAMHFDGFALLGALWQQPELAISRYAEIKRHCEQRSNL